MNSWIMLKWEGGRMKSMKPTLRQKFRYWFENFIAKGGTSIFLSLLVLFIISLVITTILRTILLAVNPDYDLFSDFFEHFWVVFLELTDPGTLGIETDIWFMISGTVTILVGLVIFSMLIAFITAQVEKVMYNFRKGKSGVIETGHTLILGWNERVFGIIKELIIANKSRKNACIVILSGESKETMDDIIHKKFPDSKTTNIVTRAGDTASLSELKRVNAREAKSVIILAKCPDSSSREDKDISDISVIKTILALLSFQENDNKFPIIAEIFSEDKRKLLETLGYHNVISINSWEILGKFLVQTSRSSGLEIVYNTILSFDDSEIYLYQSKWKNIPFNQLAFHFNDGIPMGIVKADGRLNIKPPGDTVLEETDRIFILAEDDSTIHFSSKKLFEPKAHPFPEVEVKRSKEKELILGWHSIASIVIAEYSDFLLEGSTIDIVNNNSSEKVKNDIKKLQSRYTNLKINLISGNPLILDTLSKINPFSYDNVIILAQNEYNYSPEKVDSDTLVILLLLRRLSEKNNYNTEHTKIITQVLNSENQELIRQSNVDDFIISNKLITMIMAQISENPEIKKLYDHLLQEEGSEIYLKSSKYYFEDFPKKVPFMDMIIAAQKRDEICLGLRISKYSKTPAENFGVIINPKKGRIFELTADDFIVVLAETED